MMTILAQASTQATDAVTYSEMLAIIILTSLIAIAVVIIAVVILDSKRNKEKLSDLKSDMDRRFTEIKNDMNRKFDDIKADTDRRFTEINRRLAEIDRKSSQT